MVIITDNWAVGSQTVSSRAITYLHEAEDRQKKTQEATLFYKPRNRSRKEVLAERESSDRMTETNVK